MVLKLGSWINKEKFLGQSFSGFVCAIVTFIIHIFLLSVLYIYVRGLINTPWGHSSIFQVMKQYVSLLVNRDASPLLLLVLWPGKPPFFTWKWCISDISRLTVTHWDPQQKCLLLILSAFRSFRSLGRRDVSGWMIFYRNNQRVSTLYVLILK